MSDITLCRLDDLPESGARGFSVTTAVGPLELFAVRSEGCVRGFLNSCPHTGAPLNWAPDVFLSLDGAHIHCATHDALFTIEDGLCVTGPCPGARLTPADIEVVDGRILLSLRS